MSIAAALAACRSSFSFLAFCLRLDLSSRPMSRSCSNSIVFVMSTSLTYERDSRASRFCNLIFSAFLASLSSWRRESTIHARLSPRLLSRDRICEISLSTSNLVRGSHGGLSSIGRSSTNGKDEGVWIGVLTPSDAANSGILRFIRVSNGTT